MTNSGNVIEPSRKADKKTIMLLAILVLLAFTFASAFAQPQTQPENLKPLSHASQSSSSVASSFDADLNNHDSAAALELFADGAIVSDLSNIACLPGPSPFCQSSNVFVTKTQIRGWLEQLVSINVQLNEIQTFHVSGNNVSWAVEVSVDEYRRLRVAPLEANVNAIVENGKFSSFSIELTAESTGKLSRAYATNRASPYSVMAGGLAFGVFFLGLIFPAAAIYYISRVKRLFASVPMLGRPWILLGAGVGSLLVSLLLESLRDVAGISASTADSVFTGILAICAFFVMSAMVLMKRVMIGEPDE
jgi:hypothetical protein